MTVGEAPPDENLNRGLQSGGTSKMSLIIFDKIIKYTKPLGFFETLPTSGVFKENWGSSHQ